MDPQKFIRPPDNTYFYDPANSTLTPNSDYPSGLIHVAIQMDTFEANEVFNDLECYINHPLCHNDWPVCLGDQLCMTDMTQPLIESKILATVTWLRIIHTVHAKS